MNKSITVFFLIFFSFVRCVNKPPITSDIESKGYFEDLSFLRENVDDLNSNENQNLNPNFNSSSLLDELEEIILLEENQNAEKYINGYSILIFSGTERYKADSIFFIADSIYTEHEVFNFYDQPNYRVKIGKFYYRIKANKTLENLKDNFVDAIIVPERIKIN